jgi:hypothetical protein
MAFQRKMILKMSIETASKGLTKWADLKTLG